MFELVKAYESAKNEKNKFIRFICLKYIKHQLKTVFFKKFNVYDPDFEVNEEFLTEFMQFFNCTISEVKVNKAFPCVYKVDGNTIYIKYYVFNIQAQWLEKSFVYEITHINSSNPKSEYTMTYYSTKTITFLKEIILMAIYNYCVSYIYGSMDTMLIIHDTSAIPLIHDLHV